MRYFYITLAVFILFIGSGRAVPDLRFDVATFCCPCTPDDHLCQEHFDILNWQGTNGHYIAMGTDSRRAQLDSTGNVLAIYINNITNGWTTTLGSQAADNIHQDVLSNFTSTGSVPTWIFLNEISASQWPASSSYRIYIHDLVHTLASTYNYQVLLASPFPNPGANDADWQKVSDDAYIAIEQYLSGGEILDNGTSVSWCQSQYQSSKNSYLNRGISANRLFLIEHFGQTTSGTAWGRAGVSTEAWDTCIIIRAQAARNVGFEGFVSYAWGKNAMLSSDEDLIHFEDIYRRQALPLSTSDYYNSVSIREWQHFNK